MPPIENPNSKIENPPTPFPLYPGELNLIVGRPGIGKSLLALDLAARAANATLPRFYIPDKTPSSDDSSPDPYSPGNAIVLSTENRHLPLHLLAFGIHPAAGNMPHRDERSLDPYYSDFYHKTAGRHHHQAPLISWLRHEERAATRILVLDPLPAFLGPINATSRVITDQLEPLLDFATSRGIFVIGITHLVKTPRSKDAVHQIIGSLGYSAIARCVLLVTHDAYPPQDARGDDLLHRRLIVPIKNNNAPIEAAYAFTFRSRSPLQPPVQPPRPTRDSTPEAQAAYLRFREEETIYTRHHRSGEPLPPQLLWDPQPLHHHPQLPNLPHNLNLQADDTAALDQITRAEQLLQHLLKNGPFPSRQAYRIASQEGISHRSVERARKNLHVQWHFKLAPEEPGGGHFEIFLPDTPNIPPSSNPLPQTRGSANLARAHTPVLADT